MGFSETSKDGNFHVHIACLTQTRRHTFDFMGYIAYPMLILFFGVPVCQPMVRQD
jgi:hypothetical protein